MCTNAIYQYSMLSTLMHSLAHDGLLLKEALQHGEQGIGTVPGLNGEVIIIDSEAYHFSPDTNNRVHKLAPTERLRFTMVTRFKPTIQKVLPSLTMSSVPKSLYPLLPQQQNCFLSLRVAAAFPRLTFRVLPAQSEPQESLADLAKRQTMQTVESMRGVMVGFWSPKFTSGLSVPGFHLHFISDDRTMGGHVWDFEAEVVDVKAAVVTDYRVVLPFEGKFQDEPIGEVREGDFQKAEGMGC